MNRFLQAVFCAGLALLMPMADAVPPPKTINYQGYLTARPPGSPPVDGTVTMTFRLYDAPTGAAPALWTETQMSVHVTNGNFNVMLGSVVPIALAFDAPYWLTVAINADGEMTPRVALSGAPYALRSSGIVSCNSGITNCGGVCVNLSNDANHCGACGLACVSGHACSGGVCQ